MGGFWERLIQIVKKSMFSIIKDRVLTDFQMITLFTTVNTIANNRPLAVNSHHVDDLEALTPNHFFIGRKFCNNSHLGETSSRKRWRQVQFLTEHFWKRWLKVYLPTLARQTKWQNKNASLKVGDLVLLQDSNVRRDC